MLDATESDDEADIENIMNYSDTEFVAKNESVLSLQKKRSVTKVGPYQFKKHQSTFCLPKTRMKSIL